MINNFKCSETEKIFNGKQSKKLPANIQNVARRKLRMLNNAVQLEDLRIPPANRLEQLHGNREGNIVFVLIDSGVFALSGMMATLKR